MPRPPGVLAMALALGLAPFPIHAAKSSAPKKQAAKPGLKVGDGVSVALDGGKILKGVYLGRRDGAVWIGADGGEVGVEESSILKITPVKTPDSEFSRRKAALAPGDAGGWWKLAVWARDKGLADSARTAAETVVKMDPHHAEAHELLGHVKLGERWAGFEESQRRKGMVRFEGEWMKETEVRDIKAERAKSPGIRPSGDHKGEGGQPPGN